MTAVINTAVPFYRGEFGFKYEVLENVLRVAEVLLIGRRPLPFNMPIHNPPDLGIVLPSVQILAVE